MVVDIAGSRKRMPAKQEMAKKAISIVSGIPLSSDRWLMKQYSQIQKDATTGGKGSEEGSDGSSYGEDHTSRAADHRSSSR